MSNVYLPSAYWNGVAGETYPLVWRQHADRVHLNLLKRWLPEGTRFERMLKTDAFDEAVGEGTASFLVTRARRLYCIDIAETTLRNACLRGGSSMRPVCSDARCLPFDDESFDAVVSLSTLDHFADPLDLEYAIGEIRRVLRPGGQLILTLDNPGNPIVGLRNRIPSWFLEWSGITPYFVGASLKAKPLAQRLARNGLTLRECTGILHCPRVAAIPLCSLASSADGTLGRILESCEAAEAWPTRLFTGHFVAVKAVKRTGPAAS